MQIEPTEDQSRRRSAIAFVIAVAIAFDASMGAASNLPPKTEKALEDAEYVYIASTRKDGSLGEKAEIWFMFERGKVYVGTRPTSWRVKRIRWGRPEAKVWVSSREGPSFEVKGAVVDDLALQKRMFEVFAKKYPDGWKRHEEGFREGFQDGSRVMVEYTPVAQ